MSLSLIGGLVTSSDSGATSEILKNINLFDNISTSVGLDALEYNSLGILNSVFGYQAVGAPTAVSGDGISAFGTRTLFYNRASYNSAFGARAGFSNQDGTRNTHVGYLAGAHNVSGSDQVSVGFRAGLNALGHNNVYVGSLAGEPASTTDDNTAVGGAASATGGRCVAVGAAAQATGPAAIAVGPGATASGENSAVLGPNVISEGAGSLILMPRQDGLPFASTEDETLNVYGRLVGEREMTGAYRVSLTSDRVLLDNGTNRINLDPNGTSFHSDTQVTYMCPVVFTHGFTAVSGSANFYAPTAFHGPVSFAGETSLPNVSSATIENLTVTNLGVFDGNAVFNKNVAVLGDTSLAGVAAQSLTLSQDLVARTVDADAVDADDATFETLSVSRKTELVGELTVQNSAAPATITHDLTVGGVLRGGDLEVGRLFVTGELILDGGFGLSNVSMDDVHGDLAVSGAIFAGSNVDVRSNIVFRNHYDPALESHWTIGLEVPDAERPELADLVLASSDSTAVRFTQDFATSVLNFTGSHVASHEVADDQLPECVGKIVVATGRYMDLDDRAEITADEAVPVVALSARREDPAVFGVIAAVQPDGPAHSFRLANLEFRRERGGTGTGTAARSAKLRVNSVGEGAVLVCDENGPLRNGDLIVASGELGIGARQADDVVRACTVAKITQDCDFRDADRWPSAGNRCVRLVGCIYKC